MKNKICKCEHEKRWHSLVFQACIFPDKTENWDMPEKAKKEYLRLGITELAVCTCKMFKPQKDSDIVYDDGDVQITREDYEKATGSDNSPQLGIRGGHELYGDTLSSKIYRGSIQTPHIKEFIQKLKEWFCKQPMMDCGSNECGTCSDCAEIDKLAGKELLE